MRKILLSLCIILGTICLSSCSSSNQEIKIGGNEKMSYAEKIISNTQKQDPILEILEIIQEKCSYGEGLSKLTNGERAIYLIGDVEGEVNNGGFSQYLFNSSGKNYKEAVNALKLIKAERTAALLEKAAEIYKNGPTNDGRNEPEEDELTDEQEEKLSELDDAFYEYNDDLSELQIHYIKDHLGEF